MTQTVDLTWGDADEELRVTYDWEPDDPSTGYYGGPRDPYVWSLTHNREWTEAEYAAQGDRLLGWVAERPPAPSEEN